MISLALGGILTLPIVWAQTVTQLFILRFLFGLAAAGTMPSANAIIRRVADRDHLGKAYGMTSSVTCIGFGIGPIVGGLMAHAWGYTAPFVLTSVVLVLSSVVVARLVKD